MALTKATVQAAFAAMITAASGSVVSVIANGHSADGVRAPADSMTAMGDLGEQAGEASAVRCNYDTIGGNDLKTGQAVIVDGATAKLTNHRPDQMKATVLIEYRLSQPVSGV